MKLLHPGTSHTHTISLDQPPVRIDLYLAQQYQGYSRTFFQELINQRLIAVDNSPVSKASLMTYPKATITITVPPMQQRSPQEIAQEVANVVCLFEHEHFLIINKPAGLLVHKNLASPHSASVVDWLLARERGIAAVGNLDRPGIIHRLDKDTSGLLIIARTPYAFAQFGAMFRDRTICKTYKALVHGHPQSQGAIDFPIGRDPRARHKMKAFTHPVPHLRQRSAYTTYKVLTYFPTYSLVEIQPTTGRTHQIRVHMNAIGHPIVGDSLYNSLSTKPTMTRQALHAYKLEFSFDNEPFVFTQEPPADFLSLC